MYMILNLIYSRIVLSCRGLTNNSNASECTFLKLFVYSFSICAEMKLLI